MRRIRWFYIGDLSYHAFFLEFLCLELWLYGHVHIVINIGNFNIGKFYEKSPITNINSSPINRLIRYMYLLALIKVKLVQL